MQLYMGWKGLERFVGKLLPMHLAVTGEVAHLYHIQSTLSQGEGGPILVVDSIILQYFRLMGTSDENGSRGHTSG